MDFQQLSIFIIQFCLGITLFFTINWIGKHSYSVGYLSLSVFVKVDEAPAFNFILRVLGPVIYVIIVAAILYGLDLQSYVKDIYLVNIYYVLIRLFVNIITNRSSLLNWSRQIIYWICIYILSYYAYEKIIITKKNLLPDYSNLANELWIVIIVYLYNVFNAIQLSDEATIKRKHDYVKNRIIKFKRLYGDTLSTLQIDRLIILAYAILIYEDFNRPPVIRFLEKLSMLVTKRPHTLGVMQVATETLITDSESVAAGVKKLKHKYATILDNPEQLREYNYAPDDKLEWVDQYINIELIKDYNRGSEYREGVLELFDIIEKIYTKLNQKHAK